MPVAVALDAAGQPTPALLKKLAALGVSVGADASAVPQLKRAPDGRTEALFLDSLVPGATLAEGLQKALADAITRLPIPKVMQYQLESGDGADFQPGWTSVNFVRPAHGLVALHGDQAVSYTHLATGIPVMRYARAAGRGGRRWVQPPMEVNSCTAACSATTFSPRWTACSGRCSRRST